MSTDNKAADSTAASTATASGGDDIKNLKAEFNRKLDNLKSSNDELKKYIESALKPAAPAKPVKAEPEVDMESLFYSRPGEAAKLLKEQAKSELRAELDKREEETLRRNQVIGKLYTEYPELGIQDGEFYKTATKLSDEMAKEYGNSPAVFEAAVAKTAIELGIKPKSKRPDADDDFTLSGSSSRSGRPSKREDKVDPKTELWAEALGVSMDKVKARAAKRKNWSRYE